jgi:hypothetical protein
VLFDPRGTGVSFNDAGCFREGSDGVTGMLVI